MATKCNTCGAPQPFSENSKCIYCGDTLKANETPSEQLNEFIAIKYEYNQGHFEKSLKLADRYLQKDIFNIPCWSYKIVSEFLKPTGSLWFESPVAIKFFSGY